MMDIFMIAVPCIVGSIAIIASLAEMKNARNNRTTRRRRKRDDREMTDYQKYQLQRMVERGYSLQDLMRDLTEFQSDGRTSLPVSRLFDEWAPGSGIWTREEEWREHGNDNQQHLIINEGEATCYDGAKKVVSIPEGITEIGRPTFGGITDMTGVSIPGSVTRIGPWTFAYCSSLTHISLPEGIAEVPRYAFYGCTSLTDMTIPESVTEIGPWAFSGCTGLTSITIPEGVAKIYKRAFRRCTRLVIHAPAGSYAERYAKAARIRFEATESLP